MARLQIKKTCVSVFLWLLINIVASAALLVCNYFLGKPSTSGVLWAQLAITVITPLFLLALKYFRLSDLVKPVPSVPVLLLSLVMSTCVFYVVEVLSIPFEIPDYMEDVFKEMAASVWGFIAICLLGPVFEEILCRRIIMREIGESTGHMWIGIIASALIFSLLHGNPAQCVFALPAGIVLGWLYYRTGSLIVPICAHILNNTISFIGIRSGAADPELSDPWVIVTLIVCAIVGSCLIIWLDRHCSRQ